MKWFKVSIKYAQTINIATIAENEEEAKLKAIRTLKETDEIYGVSVEIMSEEIGADWEEEVKKRPTGCARGFVFEMPKIEDKAYGVKNKMKKFDVFLSNAKEEDPIHNTNFIDAVEAENAKEATEKAEKLRKELGILEYTTTEEKEELGVTGDTLTYSKKW